MTRSDELDKMLHGIQNLATDMDTFFVFFVNDLENVNTIYLDANNKDKLIANICGAIEEGTPIANDIMDLFVSVIISYAKANPTFATKFIQIFNKIMYGVDLDSLLR